VAALGVACGGSEKAIVDRYFGALNSGDNQTLSSFAAVRLEESVESWTIDATSEETSQPAPLPALAAKLAELQTQLEENKKEANAYALDRLDDVDQVRELLQEENPIPRRLEEVAATWQAYNEKDRELKIAVGEAKHAMDSELGIVKLSVGDAAGVETRSGQLLTKSLDLTLRDDGLAKPYTMELRRYQLEAEEGGPRPMSRWVVYSLEPRG
jgi:septal ring factor EnvC (AmiA/AmiB activator)